MNRFILTLMLTLATTMSLMAEQRSDLQEEAGKIASAISVPFYGYDMGSVASVLETMLSDIDAVRAVEIFDSSSDSVIFKAYRTGAKTFISGESITEGRLQGLQQLIHPLAHEQEKIGELRLYYKPNGKDTLKLTAEERAWIKAHPELRVGNEMDWPPFDYAENGEPKGYSLCRKWRAQGLFHRSDQPDRGENRPQIQVYQRLHLAGTARKIQDG
jgi:hypothetical protein